MKPYISLALGGLALTLDFFIDERYPRIKVGRSTERSQYGVLIRKGFYYEPPHLWQFTTLILPAVAQKLDALYQEWDLRVRSGTADPKILLADATQDYSEKAPRTRGKAPAPFASEATPFAGYVSYRATFYAEFSQPLEFTRRGKFIAVNCSFEESDVKTPTA